MLHTLNMKNLFEISKRWESTEGGFAERPLFSLYLRSKFGACFYYRNRNISWFKPLASQPAARTARSRRFVVCPGDARTGLSVGTVGRRHAAHRRDEIVAAGVVPLDYEITRRSHAACGALLNLSS